MNQSLPFDGVAAVGDVGDPATWSGTPFHFWQAACRAGDPVDPWRLDLTPFRWPRYRWNLAALGRGRKPGGFQYSESFLAAAEAQIPAALKSKRIISFNQFFPRARTLARHGGELVLYLDATFPRLLDRYGLSAHMDRRTAREALQAERENFAAARAVIAFQHWTAESLVQECGVDPSKVHVVLPGANLVLDDSLMPQVSPGVAGVDRPWFLDSWAKTGGAKGCLSWLKWRGI